MSAPIVPQGFILQQGNEEVLLTWNISAGATSYPIQRSTDGVTYSSLATATTNSYVDTTVTVGTNYYYQLAASNGTDVSSYCPAQAIVPTRTGQDTLGQIRLQAQQRADRVNSQFVTVPEWNQYINKSAFELYDLLTTLYEDYYVKAPYFFATDGTTFQYSLPNDFFKLLGVDLGLNSNTNAYVTIKKFDFISRNRFVYPQLTSTMLGVFNLRYRLMGNTLMFIPTPAAGQQVRLWYIPRMTELLQDTDILDGVSGWTEYVIVDAAIKALQKEESDTSVLMAQKNALIKRIEDSAMNRDAGQPDTISDIRSRSESWGGWSSHGGDGSLGGW